MMTQRVAKECFGRGKSSPSAKHIPPNLEKWAILQKMRGEEPFPSDNFGVTGAIPEWKIQSILQIIFAHMSGLD
jgi:hypothetical protein